jgi:hypothetical protein
MKEGIFLACMNYHAQASKVEEGISVWLISTSSYYAAVVACLANAEHLACSPETSFSEANSSPPCFTDPLESCSSDDFQNYCSFSHLTFEELVLGEFYVLMGSFGGEVRFMIDIQLVEHCVKDAFENFLAIVRVVVSNMLDSSPIGFFSASGNSFARFEDFLNNHLLMFAIFILEK